MICYKGKEKRTQNERLRKSSTQSAYAQERNKDRNKIVNKILVPTDETKITNDTNTTKVQPRHGFTGQKVGKFWIKTLSKGKRRPSSLNEEDKEILKNMFGSNSEGVSKVDERTSYFDSSQGTWY